MLYSVSAIWSALAFGPGDLMVARFIGGLGVGASSIAAPVYIAEISPAESRGRLGGLFQFNIVLGMVVSQFVNWALGGISESAWRWMLGALLTFVFPAMAAAWAPSAIFAFFGMCLVAHLFWAIFICPETKGKALEEISL